MVRMSFLWCIHIRCVNGSLMSSQRGTRCGRGVQLRQIPPLCSLHHRASLPPPPSTRSHRTRRACCHHRGGFGGSRGVVRHRSASADHGKERHRVEATARSSVLQAARRRAVRARPMRARAAGAPVAGKGVERACLRRPAAQALSETVPVAAAEAAALHRQLEFHI